MIQLQRCRKPEPVCRNLRVVRKRTPQTRVRRPCEWLWHPPKDADPEDEFDCIALLDKGLVFVECKTGKGDLYGEITKFMRRDAELSATYSFFVFDGDYTFDRGQDDTPKLSARQAADLEVQSISKVTVRGQEFFRIQGHKKWIGGRMGDGTSWRVQLSEDSRAASGI